MCGSWLKSWRKILKKRVELKTRTVLERNKYNSKIIMETGFGIAS